MSYQLRPISPPLSKVNLPPLSSGAASAAMVSQYFSPVQSEIYQSPALASSQSSSTSLFSSPIQPINPILQENIDEFNNNSLNYMIEKLLREDSSHRCISKADDLITIPKVQFLNNMQNLPPYDFSKNFQMDNVLTNNPNHIYTNPDKFKNSAAKLYDHLPLIPENSGIVLAGGALISLLREQKVNDYDLFILNQSIEEAKSTILNFIETQFADIKEKVKNLNISDQMTKYNKEKIKMDINRYSYLKIIRNYNSLTIVVHTYQMINKEQIERHDDFELVTNTYQFILRQYQNIGQILHGFDLTASQIAYDGTNFYLSKSCFFNIYTNLLYFDFSVDSPSYMSRMAKYFNQKKFSYYLDGFSIRGAIENLTNIIKIKGKYDELELDKNEPHQVHYIFDFKNLANSNSSRFSTLPSTLKTSEYTKFAASKKVKGVLRLKKLYQTPKRVNYDIGNKIMQFSIDIYFDRDKSNAIFEPLAMYDMEYFKNIIYQYLSVMDNRHNLLTVRDLLGLPLYSNYVMMVGNSNNLNIKKNLDKFIDEHAGEIYNRVEEAMNENNLIFEYRGLFEGTHLKNC